MDLHSYLFHRREGPECAHSVDCPGLLLDADLQAVAALTPLLGLVVSSS
jgi:hypothetical protein